MPRSALLGFVVAVVCILASGWLHFESLEMREASAERVTATLDVQMHLQALLLSIKEAETGQRGYLLTGDEDYLAPYHAARAELPVTLEALRALLAGDEAQLERMTAMAHLVDGKLTELSNTIELRRENRLSRALAAVSTDEGLQLMDGILDIFQQLELHQRALLKQREAEWQAAVSLSTVFLLGSSGILLLLILVAGVSTSRAHRARNAQFWIKNGQGLLSAQLQGEHRSEVLGEKVMAFLARYLNAQAGTIYVADEGGRFSRVAAYACDRAPDSVHPGEGLVGEVARSGLDLHIKQVPADYLAVTSSLGRTSPTELLIAPAVDNGVVVGVIELGFLRKVDELEQGLLTEISDVLGAAIRASRDRTRLEALLEETQRQAEELQAQQEELRVSNEELEEQGRTLKQAQSQLETQHAELEQTNSQLEEHMQTLESQKDILLRAQAELAEKASDLERANQYKSEFVANMSHELRTPLNSTLILSKLLADNKEGNLSDKEVSFANTIHAAGNDLLALINDILDLSKIEAGKLDVMPAAIDLRTHVDAIIEGFAISAERKGLKLSSQVAAEAPATIVTDELRLGQILKNLVSNAIKFTDSGAVTVRIGAAQAGAVSIAVCDSGIGISAGQQGLIFEAFRQADGSTLRKYGGSGLGLSISRDLARLLGGTLEVRSEIGEGSVFTLTLPAEYQGPSVEALPVSPTAAAKPIAPAGAETSPTEAPALHIAPQRAARLILIIEDDLHFAAVLQDVAQEMGFECLVTETAREGIVAAIEHRPLAILLDMKLPDESGLTVLDTLKHDARTRHIPVHIVSISDYSQEALQRGAIGYVRKPVQRHQLAEALSRLDSKASQQTRRVLVVEDDDRQRESICHLLGGENVEITAVATAAAALERLGETTFDCMVMDISLPDINGFELLVRMVEQEGTSFPPVIVYTGRSLSREEEQRLSRFSKSIIIKSARSPERLLDEVTLFIHQVESQLPADRQRMLKTIRNRDEALEGRSVLIVEDDVRNVLALTSVLEPHGVQIAVAHNGQQALDHLSRGDPVDLVLMDIMMPVMDGLTAMREIRKNPKFRKLPIIALTAKAMRDDQEACRAAGANDYIAKPLDVERLLSLMRVWMPTYDAGTPAN